MGTGSFQGVKSPGLDVDLQLSSRSTVTGLEWLRGFQEVKVPGFHDNGTGWW